MPSRHPNQVLRVYTPLTLSPSRIALLTGYVLFSLPASGVFSPDHKTFPCIKWVNKTNMVNARITYTYIYKADTTVNIHYLRYDKINIKLFRNVHVSNEECVWLPYGFNILQNMCPFAVVTFSHRHSLLLISNGK